MGEKAETSECMVPAHNSSQPDHTPSPHPVSQSDLRFPGSQEKGEMEGDLEEKEQDLGFQIRATNSLHTKVAPAPLRCLLFQNRTPVAE